MPGAAATGKAVAQPLLRRLEEPDTAMHMVVAMLPDRELAPGRTRRCLVRRLSFVGVSLLLLAFEKTVNKALTRVLNEMVGDLVARQQTADLRQAPERTLGYGRAGS